MDIKTILRVKADAKKTLDGLEEDLYNLYEPVLKGYNKAATATFGPRTHGNFSLHEISLGGEDSVEVTLEYSCCSTSEDYSRYNLPLSIFSLTGENLIDAVAAEFTKIFAANTLMKDKEVADRRAKEDEKRIADEKVELERLKAKYDNA